MGKKKNKGDKLARRIAKLEAIVADKGNPKPERKAAKAELAALHETPADKGVDFDAMLAETEAEAPAEEVSAADFTDVDPAVIIAAADKVLADKGASPGALASAKAAKKKAERLQKVAAAKGAAGPTDETAEPEPFDDAAASARVKAKRALRKAGLLTEGDKGEAVVDPDAVPRDDAELVAAYNLVIGTVTGNYLTSDDERAAIDARIQKPAAGTDGVAAVAALLDVTPPESKPKRKAKPDEMVVEVDGETLAAPVSEAPDVEPEEPAAPLEQTDPAAGFAQPSEAPQTFATNGNGQYIVKRPSDGKLVGYTRVTTYIDNLDDKSALTLWKHRILLEGLARNEVEVGTADDRHALPEHLLARLREAIHTRDHALAKARKADRKGKLAAGELAPLLDDAMRAYKKAANAIAEQALDLGGVKDAATKGTDLHELTELYDAEGLEPIAAKLEASEITPADFADIEAYALAMQRAGVEVVATELHVVNHELKVAGRLDKIVMAKASPDAQRRSKMVADVKTGSVDFAPGKIAQQMELYASSEAYDPDTHETTALGASRTTGLLIHLPAGQAKCHVYVVDLSTGRRGNKLSAEVRRWRTESRRLSVDFKVDLAAGEAS